MTQEASEHVTPNRAPHEMLAALEEQSRRIAELENLVYAWKNNGAQHLFAGHGFSQIGRTLRFAAGGIQALLNEDAVSVNGILFTTKFLPESDIDYDTLTTPYAYLIAVANGTSIQYLFESKQGTTAATFSLESGAAYGLAKLGATPLWLGVVTSDPATIEDGFIFYRSDTDKFRGRANSATDNFAMEAWVTAAVAAVITGHTVRENGSDQTARLGLNFVDTDAGAGLITDDAGGNETEVNLSLYVLKSNTSFVDLTDGGATTLHRHLTVRTETSGITAANGDFVICNSTTAFTVTLPAATANHIIVVKNINTGLITIDGASTDTIDDQLTKTLGRYEAVNLIADGTKWWIF